MSDSWSIFHLILSLSAICTAYLLIFLYPASLFYTEYHYTFDCGDKNFKWSLTWNWSHIFWLPIHDFILICYHQKLSVFIAGTDLESLHPVPHTTRVLARIKYKRPKKHVTTTITRRLWEIFLMKCQKQAFSFNKREAKVYCYAFLHVLKRDTCIKQREAKVYCYAFLHVLKRDTCIKHETKKTHNILV
jgi:hypothetical protein